MNRAVLICSFGICSFSIICSMMLRMVFMLCIINEKVKMYIVKIGSIYGQLTISYRITSTSSSPVLLIDQRYGWRSDNTKILSSLMIPDDTSISLIDSTLFDRSNRCFVAGWNIYSIARGHLSHWYSGKASQRSCEWLCSHDWDFSDGAIHDLEGSLRSLLISCSFFLLGIIPQSVNLNSSFISKNLGNVLKIPF